MARNLRGLEIVLPCADLNETSRFFTEELGFRVEQIFPADDPSVTVLTGHGARLRLEKGSEASVAELRLLADKPEAVAGGAQSLTAPNGTLVRIVEATPGMVLPPIKPSFVVSKLSGDAVWVDGRAGMGYRDLIPDRLGGYVIASHIRIPDGGPVPDHVHFHQIHFQMIYCRKGWVRVVYEDNGEPFVMKAGDCVMQPPGIRHQVLESSKGLEVVEIGCPADHITGLDHDIKLPQQALDLERLYGGQRFVRHQADKAVCSAWRLPGFEARDIGIEAASFGIAGARVVRVTGAAPSTTGPIHHDAEFLFGFILSGGLTLEAEGQGAHTLGPDDSFVVPSGLTHSFRDFGEDTEILEVSLPGAFGTYPGQGET